MKTSTRNSKKIEEFTTICRQHNVVNLYAFGFSVQHSFDELHSEINLLVVNRRRSPYLEKSTNASKILIYDRQGM